MEFFTARGRFWLPREHDRVAVAGAVSFQEGGVRLELEGSLRSQERRPGHGGFGAPAELSEPVIHGFLRDGRDVTLLAARGFSWHADDIGEDWRAEFLLCGGHFQDDKFVEAQVCFDYLSPWARPDAVVTRKPGEDRVVIDIEDTVVDMASFDSRTKIKLCTGVEGRSSEGSVHLDQWVAWILRDGLVLSFTSLRELPLSALCDGDVEEHDTSEWAGSEDADVRYSFTDLLSRTVQDSYPDLRWHNARRHVHFRATSDLRPRKAGKGPRSRGRTVFGPHYAKSEPGRISYYHHAALRTRFRSIGGTWYCQLEPGYCFTTDGYAEAGFADSLLAGIKRMDRHPAVAGWTRMWANFLGQPPDLFSPPRPVLLGELATVTVDRGIDDRWWGPAPADVVPDEDHDHQRADDAHAAAALAAANIDTGDLLALITEDGIEPEPATGPAEPGRAPRQHGAKRPPGRRGSRGEGQ
jgi:hypothetical protein